MAGRLAVCCSAGEALGEGEVVVDHTGQHAQVHDGAVAGGYEVDDLADGGGVLVTGDDKRAGNDALRVARLVEEGPDVAGVILVVQVGADVDAVHLKPPLARLWAR